MTKQKHEDEKNLARGDGLPKPDQQSELPRQATSTSERPSKIVHNIEFFYIRDEEYTQCARCGSSTFHRSCDNCGGEGCCEDDDWQWPSIYTCDWCQGKGGWFRCLSSEEFCKANPMPGREDQPVMGCNEHDYD